MPDSPKHGTQAYCPRCGRHARASATNCPNCGGRLAAGTPVGVEPGGMAKGLFAAFAVMLVGAVLVLTFLATGTDPVPVGEGVPRLLPPESGVLGQAEEGGEEDGDGADGDGGGDGDGDGDGSNGNGSDGDGGDGDGDGDGDGSGGDDGDGDGDGDGSPGDGGESETSPDAGDDLADVPPLLPPIGSDPPQGGVDAGPPGTDGDGGPTIAEGGPEIEIGTAETASGGSESDGDGDGNGNGNGDGDGDGDGGSSGDDFWTVALARRDNGPSAPALEDLTLAQIARLADDQLDDSIPTGVLVLDDCSIAFAGRFDADESGSRQAAARLDDKIDIGADDEVVLAPDFACGGEPPSDAARQATPESSIPDLADLDVPALESPEALAGPDGADSGDDTEPADPGPDGEPAPGEAPDQEPEDPAEKAVDPEVETDEDEAPEPR